MKKYVVMVDYGCYEGWQLQDETDDFDEAVKIRETAMGHGHSHVQIFKPVELVVIEKSDDVEDVGIEQRDAGIAEAKEAAEREAAKSYAKARGELTSLHKAIQEATLELNRRKDEHLAHLHQRNEEEAKWEMTLASRKASIAEAKASYRGIEQDIMKMTLQQQVLRDEWEGEQRAAEQKLAAVKQEIGALLVKLHI